MNKVILTGRLTKEPETRYSQSAEPITITRFTIAVNRKIKKDGEQDADFLNCVAFGKNAELISKYVTKGKLIGIVGNIKISNWTDNNNQKRTSTEIQVDEVEFLEKKSTENKEDNPINDNNLPY